MKKYKKVDLSFQSCTAEYKDSPVVIYSAPFDATTSFRPGTRFGGNAVRVDSIGVEWYSPYRDANLKNYNTCDVGDLDLPVGNVPLVLKKLKKQLVTLLMMAKYRLWWVANI